MGVITGRLVGAAGPTALAVPTVGQVVENVTALRALVGSADLPAVTLAQYQSAVPGKGGGVFMWDAAAGDDDGVLRFNAGGEESSGEGWRRVFSGALYSSWGGAVGDGSTPDATALQRVLDASAGAEVVIEEGTYACAAGLTAGAGTAIRAHGATLDFSAAGNVTGLTFVSGGGISGATLLGAGGGVYDDAGRAIYCSGTNNHPSAPTYVAGPKLRDCTITGWAGYGVFLQFVTGADIQKNAISDIGYAGVAGLSCSDCVCDDNDISDVNGTGALDGYGAFFDRSNGASETSVPRSYRCSMSRNRVSNIHTAANSQGLDTHAGVEFTFCDNVIWDVDLGIAVVASKLGASFALAPQRCTIRGNIIVGRNANTGIVLTGASDDGVTFNEMAEGNTICGNVIVDAGLADNVYDGGIRFYGTTNTAVTGNTIVRPNINGITLENENHGFNISGNTIVDPHGPSNPAVCVRLHSNGQKGFVGGNTFRRENPALDANVADYAVFATVGRLDFEVTIGANAHVGATATALRTLTNGVAGIDAHQRLADAADLIGDAPYTLQVGLSARHQVVNVSALTTNRVITLSTTNATAGDTFEIVRTVGDTGGPWTMDVGGLIYLRKGEYCTVTFDGSAWALTRSGKLLKSGTGSPEGAVTGNVGDVFHRTDGGAGTTLYVKESGAATNTGWVAHGAIGLGLLAPGSESYSSGQWHIQYQRLQLTSAQRLTLAGTARYILTDL